MTLSDHLYKILPEDTFVFLRRMYRKYQHVRYPKLTEQNFSEILTKKLGINQGMVVYIHSSVDKLNLAFSPLTLLNLLQDAVGESGTLLFPCWHFPGRAADYLRRENAVFDVERSVTMMGLLPELARRYPGAVRSLHPTASVVAIGRLAKELTREHHLDVYPNGIKSPLFKMMEYDSKIIGLGERVVSLSFVHVVEDVMKEKFPLKALEDEVYRCKVIDEKGNTIEVNTLVPHINIAHRNIPAFFDKYISKDAYQKFRYRGINFFEVSPRQLFDEMKLLAGKNITIYSG
ncbi:MAG: AAC(3) family N-acetyltransferase [Chlorobi bacterium]|nr:AAC(3) family N-acetyltransferase [Chlorobiota bacterium]